MWRPRAMYPAIAGALLGVCVGGGAGAEEPFFTEEAETLEAKVGSVDFGFLYRHEPRNFGVAERDAQTDFGKTRLSFGLGKLVEVQLRGAVTTRVESEDGDNYNSGDWIFGTKIYLLGEKGRRPALSFLYEVKLPNGSDELGGATDETDFFGYLIASKGLSEHSILHVNLGLGILGNPFANSAQNDIGILRLAWERKLGPTRLVGLEAVVQSGPMDKDDPVFLHALIAQKVGRYALYAGGAVGLTEDSDEFLVDIGVRRRFSFRRPQEPARRNSW